MTAAIAALGAALVLGRVLVFGEALSSDSAHYIAIAAARGLLAGEGTLGFDGITYAAWPPIYPQAGRGQPGDR